ncbi:Sec-independent protein translocase TatC [Syntrophobotulus glycolicus DSM 8271]|uniref:Sec-independent protein translocase protein TatC n=1 Tax=Syntrophobotulus glycolicus (strain DSM 8271 / FlGlyR) TaxID=645991 RepID=F0SYX1_SYNGF|nr:twin-arginine translocase subunit TatC [Syntrophobotulus glycolicus]ADY56008.1 Sec-independent protein translocase TatC [Syntrophobotulus glycolicus DSM 8271]
MRRRRHQVEDMPLLEHLKALRKVLLISAYAIAIGTALGWFASDLVYRFLAEPVVEIGNVDFITTTPMEPVMVKLKVSVIVGIIIAAPVLFWQIWSFLLPALKKNERKYLYFMVPSSVLLFLGGAAFCFFVVLPVGLRFLLSAGGGSLDVTPLLSKSAYLDFIITLFLSFGLVFQMPIILLLLIKLGYLSPKTLAKYRKYAFLTIIVIAVVISPTPDLMTQMLMALPMYFLYEISIWLGILIGRKKKKTEAAAEQ